MAQLLSTVTPGTLVKLNENDSPVEFYVSKHDYESGLNGAGRTLLVRKDVFKNGQWNFNRVNAYAGSAIDQWFKGTYKALLDTWVQEAIGTTTFYYTPGNNDKTVVTLSRAVFALSLTEIGGSNIYANIEGSTLPIHSILRETTGVATEQWTRSPVTAGVNSAWTMSSEAIRTCDDEWGYRPCITLPGTLYVRDDGTVSQYAGPAPATITTSAAIMQGNSVHISWDGVEGADSYILQRKADNGEWTQVYAGALTTYTDTAGSWTTVQYQVCGVFDGGNGAFAQSDPISIIPASALVISGTDGDLGTITSDISYSVATDTGNPISLTLAVNGAQVSSGSVGTSYTSKIPVMGLPTGTGTIVITATVQTSSDPVTVTRTWTYTKAAASFQTSGGVASLSYGSQPIFPQTLAEAVKAIGGPWGGNLSTALNKLAMAATYSATVAPKYTKVNVNLSTAQSGDIVNLPVNGVMTPHIVVQVGNPDPSMYDSSCNGVWLLRKDIVENGQWNSANVNTLEGSTIMTTMQGYVDNYDATVQAAIKTVKIPYCTGGGNTTVKTLADGLECKMFPLGGYEVGWSTSTNQYFPVDGAVLSYFQGTSTIDTKRIANLNGNASTWWLRSPFTAATNFALYTFNNGNYGSGYANGSAGLRPCFLLPTTFTATYYVDESGNVYPAQEYTTEGDFYDLWGNVIPTVKIATGSYVGTGTYGSGNPNTLTFPFEPKFLLVQSTNTYTQNFGYMIWNFGVAGPMCGLKNGAYDFATITFSQNGKTVSWYSDSAAFQMNYNTGYKWVAIG